jgi:hypothetical protein
MQTNQEFFNTLTVAQLKDRLSDFNAIGISKARKSELVGMLTCLMDGAHIDAMALETVDSEMRKAGIKAVVARKKSYNERMINRLFGYHTQNGFGHMLTIVSTESYDSPSMMDKLTPKQARRYAKKYNRQYARLS